MNEIIAILMITVLTIISPEANFALVSRNSYLYGREQGLYTAYGIACAVWIHIGYSVQDLSFFTTLYSQPTQCYSIGWCAVFNLYRL